MRVRIRDTAEAVGFPSYYQGCDGTIVEERKFGPYDVRVRIDGMNVVTWFARGEVEVAARP